ncbi:MAG: hypothetical protein FJ013_06135 [Chloroflexi bacterium]|nr:hypothetical protein [Chloroflexota bacterium]
MGTFSAAPAITRRVRKWIFKGGFLAQNLVWAFHSGQADAISAFSGAAPGIINYSLRLWHRFVF